MAKRQTPPRYKSGPNKGKFKPRRKRRKRRTTAASKPKRRKARRISTMARRRRRSAPRRRRRSSGAGARKVQTGPIIASAAIGYLQNQTTMLSQLPQAVQPTSAKGKLVGGAALYLLNKHAIKHKYVGYAAQALLTIGAYEAGQNNFAIQGEVGWDGAYAVPDEVSGEL